MSLLNKKCEYCNTIFLIDERFIKYSIKVNQIKRRCFCSKKCSDQYHTTSPTVECANCKILFKKQMNQIKKCKNNFCCQSCAAIYNNKHKTTGTRRSKLECFVEKMLKEKYTNIVFRSNFIQKSGYELDFYFPDLKIAIEINGIFHYKPIYGLDKLNRIKKNDRQKKKLCKQDNIKLYILKDNLKKFSLEYANKFSKRVTKIIDSYQ
jgi:hypothetical protein